MNLNEQRYKTLRDPATWAKEATEKRPHMKTLVLEFQGGQKAHQFIKYNEDFMGNAPFAIISDMRTEPEEIFSMTTYIDFRFDRELNDHELLSFAGTLDQYLNDNE